MLELDARNKLWMVMCWACALGFGACAKSTSEELSAGAGGSSAAGGSAAVTAATGAAVGGSASGSGSVSAGSVAANGGSPANGEAGRSGSTGSSASPEPFSFFVTSLAALQRLSGDQNGFGGDLRFGQADGLRGADEICRQIADTALPGAGDKTWHAFLSVTKGPAGTPIHAIDRVGNGPWYDRLGRFVAMNKSDLAQSRPNGADATIINDLPNEDGVPNHAPDGTNQVDNHDTLTGSSSTGQLYSNNWSVTCHDWTSAVGSDGKPRVGHSWPRGGGRAGTMTGQGGGMGGGDMANWMSSLDEAGCAPGVSLIETGPPNPSNPTVGSGGGYGGFYCFALTP